MRVEPGRDVVDDDVDAVAEALGAGELLAVVDDVDAEAGVVRHLADEVADVAGAEDVDSGDGSTGSMKTSIWPPQTSPVSWAKSSLSSNFTLSGLRDLIASRAFQNASFS